MDESYTKRELDNYFQNINRSLGRIEAQVISTNGNVRKLQIWKAYITGAIAILGVVLGITVPLIIILLNKIL